MSLAHELHETNELLRDVAKKLEPVPELVEPLRQDPVPVGRIMPAAAMLALRAHLKPVPEDYGKVQRRDLARVVCVCRRGHRFTSAGFQECGCGRVFAFTGRRLLVMRPDEEAA